MLISLVVIANCSIFPAAVDSQFSDKVGAKFGTCGADELTIIEGTKYVNGRSGKDVFIDKTMGLTYVQGGTGNDIFYSGLGQDIYFGGSGFDSFVFDGPFGPDQIIDLNVIHGDRLIFVTYASGSIDEVFLRSNLATVTKDGIHLDLSCVDGFFGSTLLLRNLTQRQFKKLDIEIRVIKK